jgi:uncharacterized protein DUF1844
MVDSEEEEKPKAFKVDDRRRFSPEGELKPEFQGADEPAATARTDAPPGGSGETAASAAAASASASTSAGSARTADRPSSAESRARANAGVAPEITFGTFVVGLSTQALVHLGEIPDPLSGQPSADLAAAQQLIDIIAILKEKTQGNLDRDEDALLETILFELRMKYVERARQAPR